MVYTERPSPVEAKTQRVLGALHHAFDITGGMGEMTYAMKYLEAEGDMPEWVTRALAFCASTYLDTPLVACWMNSNPWFPFANTGLSEKHRELILAKDRVYTEFQRSVLRYAFGGDNSVSIANPSCPFSPEEIVELIQHGIDHCLVINRGNSPAYKPASITSEFFSQAQDHGVVFAKDVSNLLQKIAFSEAMRGDLRRIAAYKLASMLGWTHQLWSQAKRMASPISFEWQPEIGSGKWQKKFGIERPSLEGLYNTAYLALIKYGGNPSDTYMEHIFSIPRLATC
jgi:hypothetical protein